MSLLVASGLQYTFPSGFVAGPVDLDLGAGVHHLVGPNGSGKTTLLRCLCADLRRSTGTLSVDGLDPRVDPEGRRHIALLPAEPELPGFLTIDEAWSEIAAIRGTPDWPGGALRQRLDLPGDLPLGHCSAGQRRLAELLVAAVGDPVVMLLDEPFANLDPARIGTLADLIVGWRSHRAVVITSHTTPPVPIDSIHPVG